MCALDISVRCHEPVIFAPVATLQKGILPLTHQQVLL
jgi:hypothetical protein